MERKFQIMFHMRYEEYILVFLKGLNGSLGDLTILQVEGTNSQWRVVMYPNVSHMPGVQHFDDCVTLDCISEPVVLEKGMFMVGIE